MAFNLQATIAAASSNSIYPTYIKGKCGYCARAVRTYLERGGINTSGRPNLARQYVNYLPTIGFSLVTTLTGGNNVTDSWTSSSAKPGDIAVYKKPGLPNEPGHICIFNGSRWVSDFYQQHMNVYSGRTLTAYIFRWTGKIDYNAIVVEPPAPAPSYIGNGSMGSNYGSGSNNYSSYSSNVGAAVFSDSASNGMSITTYVNTQNEEVKHTRIYSTLDRSITVSELSMPMAERDVPIGNTNQNQTPA